jgi:molybdenum cofactor cytidylyltransferase
MSGFAAIVLAAGRSSRMGDRHKLLAMVDGQPMICHAVQAALDSQAEPVIVVTGHRHDEVAAALHGLDVTFVHNADFATGMASSLAVGIAAVPAQAQGAVIVLGDMPRITSATIDALIGVAMPAATQGLTVPVHKSVRGNPVVIGRDWFGVLAQLQGDAGARHVIKAHPHQVVEVDIATASIFFDVDTPDILDSLAMLPDTP